MLSEAAEFDTGMMVDRKLAKKSKAMSNTGRLAEEAVCEKQDKPVSKKITGRNIKKSGVTSKKRKKVG